MSEQAVCVTYLAHERLRAMDNGENKGDLACDIYKNMEVTLGIQDITDNEKKAGRIEGRKV
jgi:hypothetical protein